MERTDGKKEETYGREIGPVFKVLSRKAYRVPCDRDNS